MSSEQVVFTQKLTMHINGGSSYSQLSYDICADGKPTCIRRCKSKDGSPGYLITADVFRCGEDTFDNHAARGVGLLDWLKAHAACEETGMSRSLPPEPPEEPQERPHR